MSAAHELGATARGSYRARACCGAWLVTLAAAVRPATPEGDAIIVGMTQLRASTSIPRVGTDEASQKAHQLLFNTLLRIDNQLRLVPGAGRIARAAGSDSPTSRGCARACCSTTAAS